MKDGSICCSHEAAVLCGVHCCQSPIVLAASSDTLFLLSSDTSYALVIWVKWGIPPTATSVVAQIENSASVCMIVTQGTDGQ